MHHFYLNHLQRNPSHFVPEMHFYLIFRFSVSCLRFEGSYHSYHAVVTKLPSTLWLPLKHATCFVFFDSHDKCVITYAIWLPDNSSFWYHTHILYVLKVAHSLGQKYIAEWALMGFSCISAFQHFPMAGKRIRFRSSFYYVAVWPFICSLLLLSKFIDNTRCITDIYRLFMFLQASEVVAKTKCPPTRAYLKVHLTDSPSNVIGQRAKAEPAVYSAFKKEAANEIPSLAFAAHIFHSDH